VRTDPVIARLAAANPFPPAAPPRTAAPRPRVRRRTLIAALAALLVAVPAVALATDVGGLFGFSTGGQPVATADTPFSLDSGLEQAMTDLGFPSTLQLIATRDGISFYAARRADGYFCFAVDADPGAADHKGVGCDLGNPSLPGNPGFPSPARPIIDFSRFSNGEHVAGFAADGVASVDLLDAAGNVIASAPVSDNVYAIAGPPAGGAAVEALDAQGTVVYERSFDQAP
jgi:hypothetical protein